MNTMQGKIKFLNLSPSFNFIVVNICKLTIITEEKALKSSPNNKGSKHALHL